MPDNTRRGRTRDEYAPTDPKYVVVPGQGRPGGPSTPSGPTLAQFLSNIATGAAKKIGETVGQTATGVATGVAGIGLPQSANAVGVTPAVGAGYAALLGKTAEKAVVETAGVYDKYIWEPWTHAETSLLGTVATLEQGKGWDDPKAIWDKAWQASDRALQPNPLTPGQAAVSVLQNLPVIKQIFEPPPQYTVNDLFDPAEREKYKTNSFLRWSSGALDFSNNIFGDPTIIGGKAIKLTRLAVSNPLMDVTKNVFRTAEQRTAFEAGAQERMAARQAADDAAQTVRDHDVAMANIVDQQLQVKKAMDEALADPSLMLDPATYEKQINDLHDQWKLLDEQRKIAIDSANKAAEHLANVRSTYMPPASAGAQTFIDAVHDYGYSAHEIMKNYTLREFGTNASTAASIIDAAAKLGDKTVTTDALRALTGDVNAYQRLYDKATVVHEMLRRANGDLSYMNLHLDAMKKHAGDMAEYVADTQMVRDRISREVDELIKYDGFLREAIGEQGNQAASLRRQFARADGITDPLYGVSNFIQGPAGYVIAKVASKLDEIPVLIEQARIGKSASQAAIDLDKSIGAAATMWRARTYQFHHLARPVVVLQWLGRKAGREVPHGWVVMHGIGSEDGPKEFEAWVNSVKAWDNKLDFKQKLLNDYITAGQLEHGKETYIGDLRSKILLQAERQAFIDTAALYYDKMLTDEQRNLLSSIKDAENKITDLKTRAKAGEDVKAELADAKKELADLKNEWSTNHGDRVDWLTPTGTVDNYGNKQVLADFYWMQFKTKRAKQMQAILATRDEGVGRPGYFVDEDGKIVMTPVLDSQLEYSHPMMDMRVLEDAFKSASRDQIANQLSIARQLGLAGVDATKQLISTSYNIFDRVWRPATLLRLGYTQRNVAEAWLRSIAYFGHGVIAMAPFAAEGAKGWSMNRWSRWQQKIESVQQWKELTEQGIPVDKSPLFMPGNVKTWGKHLEETLAMQREQLNFMEDGKRITYSARIKEMEADLADAQALVRELKARAKAGEDVAESLRAARSNVRKLSKDLRDSKTSEAQVLVDAQRDKVARLEGTYRDFNTMLAKPGSKLNRIKGGDGEFVISGHMVPEAFSDTSGQVLRDMVSSSTRANVDMNLQGAISLEEGQRFGKKATIYNPPNARGLTVKEITGDPEYFIALENWVHQLRNDTLAQRMLEPFKTGAPYNEQILESLSNGMKYLQSAEGRAYVERVKTIGMYDELTTPVEIANHRIDQLMSASGEKQDLLQRFATDKKRILAPELRRELFDNPHLRPVHGLKTTSFDELRRGEGWVTALLDVYRKGVERGFKILGSMPEDALVRHPFARNVYNTHMMNQVDNWLKQGGIITQDIMDRMANDARQLAVKETRKTLYTIMREKGMGSTRIAKAISPFIQAQFNSVNTWSHLLYQNPEAIGYLAQMWDNLDKLGTVDKDPQTGETYITFKLPSLVANTVQHVSPAMANAIRTYGEWKFIKSGANLIMPGLRGDDITTQAVQTFGIGPLVQIPIGHWIINNPAIDQDIRNAIGISLPVREVLQRFIPDDQLPRESTILGSIGNQLLPAALRNINAAFQKEDSYRFAQTALILAQSKMRDFIDNPKNAEVDLNNQLPKIYAEAEHEATMFMLVRAVANLSLPIVPRYESALQPYVNQLRQYQDQYGNQQGFAKFVEENPKLWFINASLSSNVSGMDSTRLSVFLAKKNNKLMDTVVGINPKFASMVTDTVKVGRFDTAANLWKRNQSKFVAKKDVKGAVEDSQRAIGWLQYHHLNEAVDAFLKQNGNASIQSNPGLMLWKASKVYQLKQLYPAWADDKNTLEQGAWEKNVKAAAAVAFNDGIIKDTQNYDHMKWVRAYFQMRDQIAAELEKRKIAALQASGIAKPTLNQIRGEPLNIDSADARDLRAIRDAYVSQLRANPMFADFYDRWLDSDKFTFVEGIPK